MSVCRVCKTEIVIPHCQSPTCTWCRACVDAKHSEGKKP